MIKLTKRVEWVIDNKKKLKLKVPEKEKEQIGLNRKVKGYELSSFAIYLRFPSGGDSKMRLNEDERKRCASGGP